MLYKKSKDIRYVEMAMWLDENVYRDDLSIEEEETAFIYLYHLARMLAFKDGLFKRSEYYDDFSIFFATSIWERIKNPKQYTIDEETGEPIMPKIKSVLNYMKNVAFARKIQFEQECYSRAYTNMLNISDNADFSMDFSFVDRVSESISDISDLEFTICLGEVCKTIKAFLKRIPYKPFTVEWYNIYLSCLLTFLSSMTIPNATKKRLKKLKSDVLDRPKAWMNLYNSTPENSTVLYHLDESMSGYIWILVQEIKHIVAKDLSLTSHVYVPYSSSMDLIAIADINMEDFAGCDD